MSNKVMTKEVEENLEGESKIEKVQEKTSEKLSNAAKAIHNKTDEAQEFLGKKVENVEDILRKKTYEVSNYTQQKLVEANELGHRAANMIDNSSKYIKDIDVNETKEKAVRKIKKNPEITIAVAGVFGLLVGLILGRRSR